MPVSLRQQVQTFSSSFRLSFAAFVADIYGTTVQQGPSLPMANRSALTRTYSGNQTLYLQRINAALDTVSNITANSPSVHLSLSENPS